MNSSSPLLLLLLLLFLFLLSLSFLFTHTILILTVDQLVCGGGLMLCRCLITCQRCALVWVLIALVVCLFSGTTCFCELTVLVLELMYGHVLSGCVSPCYSNCHQESASSGSSKVVWCPLTAFKCPCLLLGVCVHMWLENSQTLRLWSTAEKTNVKCVLEREIKEV